MGPFVSFKHENFLGRKRDREMVRVSTRPSGNRHTHQPLQSMTTSPGLMKKLRAVSFRFDREFATPFNVARKINLLKVQLNLVLAKTDLHQLCADQGREVEVCGDRVHVRVEAQCQSSEPILASPLLLRML